MERHSDFYELPRNENQVHKTQELLQNEYQLQKYY